ncbi:mediator complex- subunit Med18 [Apiospora kogelbergensis]|uniref:mediator complex- subunit Med18 n=1 Tax=Apiospora kogelbergensis TaxID=1337665 RepID=UPI00312FDE50
MYELSFNGTIFKADIDNARAVLGGICWSTGLHTVKRVLTYAGPPQPHPRGLPRLEHVTQISPTNNPQQPPSRPHPAWGALSKELSRSSYYVRLAYLVSPEKSFGAAAGDVDLNKEAGTLQWLDFPDPPKGQPFTQRRKMEIPGQGNLPMVMVDNKYAFEYETIEETWSYVKDGDFGNRFHTPPHITTNRRGATHSSDPSEKWLVSIRSFAWEESNPEEIKKATSQILEEKTFFDGLFTFEPVDRKDLDTRVPPPGRAM